MKPNKIVIVAAALFALSAALGGEDMFIDKNAQDGVREYLLGKYGDAHKPRIERGVGQVAAFWRAEDGSEEEFAKFCQGAFVAEPERLQALFARLEAGFEALTGHLNRIHLELKRPLHLDQGEILAIDERFGRIDPAAHLSDDLEVAFEKPRRLLRTDMFF